jgi:transcriptional regulator with XRE-family HTH domain
MVNTQKFATRLNKILEYYDLSAASFADKIEVGRSSISHILSGRNKPSLDFVMKVVKNFPEVELYWLLNGKGKFPSQTDSQAEPETAKTREDISTPPPVHGQEKPSAPVQPTSFPKARAGKEIQKIVIFYTDGSFEAFEN